MEATGRMQLLLLVALAVIGCSASAAPQLPDQFGIYVADLSGGNFRKIAQNSWQQMSHPRVSPDGQWITFTRYNKKKGGLAKEDGGNYEETEIMLCRIDGSDMKTVVPPKPGILNCNSNWTDGGSAIIWISTDNPEHKASIMKMDLNSGKVDRIPTPKDMDSTDPHIVGDQMVFPVIGKKVNSLWMMNLDGSNLREITHPKPPGGFRFLMLPAGDYDPKLSPDGTKVAYMRLMGRDDWKIWVVDLKTGEEKNISGDNVGDIVPDWSSDGQLLVFSHIDTKDFRKMGLYTMKPDGSDRKLLPLPRGHVANQPQFFPNSGSGPDAMIIYQTLRVPQMP